MKKWVLAICLAWSATVLSIAAESAASQFTTRPAAKKIGDKVSISFAVDKPTDVAVFIENANGRVIRHLVAGMLGANAPVPLKPDTLQQNIEWDGLADYGKPATGGPFRVRVALGVGVKYDKVLVRDEQAFNNIKGLAVGPDGTVYVLDHCGGAVWKGEQIMAFGRDGKYKRSVLPFPAGKQLDQVKELGGIDLRGQIAPLVQSHRLKLFPGPFAPRKTGMAVTPDGKAVVRLAGGHPDQGPERISVVGADSTVVWSDPAGPQMLTETYPPSKDKKYRGVWSGTAVLALSSDGKWAYTSGHASRKMAYPVVFRSPLPSRAPAQPFFGEIASAGKGNSALGGKPEGLACDGKGNLLISDTANDRVLVVQESDGSYVAEFEVKKPGLLAVDPKRGTVYVASGKRTITFAKYSGWRNAKLITKTAFRVDGNGTFVVGLDANAPEPLLWIGTDGGSLLQLKDKGAKFGELTKVSSSSLASGAFIDMYTDRFRPDREIYWRASNEYWSRYNEATGKIENLDTKAVGVRNGGGTGAQLMPSPKGDIYALRYPYHLLKFDRNLKPSSGFQEGGYPDKWIGKTGKEETIKKGPAHGMFMTANMTEMKHTLGVRQDGNIFVFHPPNHGGRPPKALHQYLPTGKKVTTDPIIWKVSDGCIGPRFDAQGNIYVAETINPGKSPYPEEFEKMFGKVEMSKTRPSGVQDEIANMYGSIVKFGPEGGMFHLPGTNPFRGEPKLTGLKTVEAGCYSRSRQSPVKVTGAKWMAFGYSHVETNSCICETTRFDVDEFGRVWFPDLCLYQVRVVDTAGNPILKFGGYGNAESMGPESPVLDESTGQLRPARSGEISPFAKPEIAFSWLVGVAATDNYVYTGDSINRRMLRLKMTYATEETCGIE